jgi:FAD/FMN-containing dehydrogenase
VASHFRGFYLSFETDQSPEQISEARPAPAPARLRSLKKQYDPDNVCRENSNIDPLGE